MSLAHARRAEIRSPFHVGSGDLGSRIGFGGAGIPPYRALDTSGLDLWSEVCPCLSTPAYPSSRARQPQGVPWGPRDHATSQSKLRGGYGGVAAGLPHHAWGARGTLKRPVRAAGSSAPHPRSLQRASGSDNSPPRQRRGGGQHGGAGVAEQESRGSRVGSPQSHRERREAGRRARADQADPPGCIAVKDRA